MTMTRPVQALVEVRCVKCAAYLASMPHGTPFRLYCRACGLKFESRAGTS